MNDLELYKQILDRAERVSSFDPASLHLRPDFRLLQYTGLKGCGCKLPKADLDVMLEKSGVGKVSGATHGLLMDCSEVMVPNTSLALVSTHDFFNPLLDDPYIMGCIGAANVLSDLYAHGCDQPNSVLMTLGVCIDMDYEEKMTVTSQMVAGFRDVVAIAGCEVSGGQTVMNPWPIIGGIAMAVVPKAQVPDLLNARPGDVIVLTKPLGAQLAINLFEWYSVYRLKKDSDLSSLTTSEKRCLNLWNQVAVEGAHVDGAVACRAMDTAARNMVRLNRAATRLMKECNVHAATDVTGFGVWGHADRVARNQRECVQFCIETLPVFKDLIRVNDAASSGDMFKFRQGKSAETSGGLLCAFAPEDAQVFCDRILSEDGFPAYVIGTVVKAEDGQRKAFISESVQILEV